jgi:hypothetical protein
LGGSTDGGGLERMGRRQWSSTAWLMQRRGFNALGGRDGGAMVRLDIIDVVGGDARICCLLVR